MRVFAGFSVPPLVTDRLSALRLRLAAPKDGLRWTTPEQWHITLRFFGDLEAEQMFALREALSRFREVPPLLRMETLGHFHGKGILYAAIELSEPLIAFHTALTSRMALESCTASSLAFHPHITLARSKAPAGLKSLRNLTTPAVPSFGSTLQWPAGPVHLFESILGPHGAAYNTIATQAPATD